MKNNNKGMKNDNKGTTNKGMNNNNNNNTIPIPQLCHWKTAPNIVPGNWSTLDGGPVHSEGGFLFSEPFTNAIFTITIA